MVCKSFIKFVQEMEAKEKAKVKPQKSIHYYSYCKWSRDLRRKHVGAPGAKYAFPAQVLTLVRELLPCQVTGQEVDKKWNLSHWLYTSSEGYYKYQNYQTRLSKCVTIEIDDIGLEYKCTGSRYK